MTEDGTPHARTIAVASYNVHGCVGSDLRRDPARIASVIRDLRAPVVGLQEVESHPDSEGEANQARYLEQATGLRAIGGVTMKRGDSEYGNMLLTSEPILSVTRHDLTISGREPRGALDVELETGSGRLRVVVTHLGLSARERKLQAAKVLEILGRGGATRCVLMGDINEWWPRGPALEMLARRFGRTPSPGTYPAILPLLALDRIWFAPREALLSLTVHRTLAAIMASDHLPLRAVIELKPPGSAAPLRRRGSGADKPPAPSG